MCLVYNTTQYMDFRVFGVKEFNSDVVLMFGPIFDLQIQYGCQYFDQKGTFFRVVTESSR